MVSGVLAKELEVLQDPSDFAAAMCRGLGEGSNTEVLDTVLDWKSSFEAWDEVSFHGHTQTAQQTARGERAVHVFKFTQRKI